MLLTFNALYFTNPMWGCRLHAKRSRQAHQAPEPPETESAQQEADEAASYSVRWSSVGWFIMVYSQRHSDLRWVVISPPSKSSHIFFLVPSSIFTIEPQPFTRQSHYLSQIGQAPAPAAGDSSEAGH